MQKCITTQTIQRMKHIFTFLLLSIFSFSFAQIGICYNAYIWTFSTNQSESDENLPDAEDVTLEFESLLSQRYDYDCHLLQRRYLADLQAQIDNQNAILSSMSKMKPKFQDSLKNRDAEVVVLGKIEKKKDNKVKLLVSFNALQDKALLIQDYCLMPQKSWEEDAVRRDTLNHLIDRLLHSAYGKGGSFPSVNPLQNKTQLPNPQISKETTLSGSFSFLGKGGESMPVARLTTKAPIIGGAVQNNAALGIYRMKQAYHSGTEYQMFLTQQQAAYMYIIGSDLKTGNLYDLFPLEEQKAYVQAGERIALPPDNYIQLDNTEGLDYMCIITSPDALDMTQIKANMQNATGSFSQKITLALEGKLTTANNVIFEADSPAFRLQNNDKKAVVTIVEIEHLK